MQEHQDAPQLRASGDERGGPRAALQYVRKVSGSTKPSKANEAVFQRAVDEIAHITAHLLEDLVTAAPPRDREAEAAKARARAEKRFGAAATSAVASDAFLSAR